MGDVYQMEVFFEGRVQGVGFRYATLQLARGFAVTGEVENLADGRVRLLAEGDQAEIEAFVDAVRREMSGYTRSDEARGPALLEGARRETFQIV